MSKHTKAPWEWLGEKVFGDDGLTVCSDVNGEDQETYEANARLIAAAPDLYEALQGLISLLDSGCCAAAIRDEDGPVGSAMRLARAAIAKAEGERK